MSEAVPENTVEAEFALESPGVCPNCRQEIETVEVVRLLRTKVNFISSLPRRGQLVICPRCKSVLCGSLGGLV